MIIWYQLKVSFRRNINGNELQDEDKTIKPIKWCVRFDSLVAIEQSIELLGLTNVIFFEKSHGIRIWNENICKATSFVGPHAKTTTHKTPVCLARPRTIKFKRIPRDHKKIALYQSRFM